MTPSETGWNALHVPGIRRINQYFFYMKVLRFLLRNLPAVALLLAGAFSCTRIHSVDVIPAPAEVSVSRARMELASLGEPRTGLDTSLPAEGYVLKIGRRGVKISAADSSGLFYARQTLAQLAEADGTVPVGTIKDAPRFPWRAYMLDASRHFVPKETVLKVLDWMARYKLNKFHWHLTDSDGWRLEIDGWPELTGVGAMGCRSNPAAPARYYTKDDVREVVAYAAERCIEVIPEVDMPGHASASNRAYPAYDGGGTERLPSFTFNVGKEETYAYLSDVLAKTVAQFPGRYLHLGGDEVDFASEAWKSKPEIMDLIAREGLDGIKGAEGYFDRRMQKVVQGLGKTCLMWCDALEFGLPSDEVIYYWWRHDRKDMLHSCLDGGYRTVLCPRHPLYYDFIQADGQIHGRTSRGTVWMGPNRLEDIHAYPDTEEDAFQNGKLSPLVLGVEACLWTEMVENPRRVEFMTFPRLAALAESAWSRPEVKDWNSFSARMEREYGLYDRAGLWYYDPRDPQRHSENPD